MSTQEIDRQAIMSRALRHGFTLRQQPGGEMDLNEYVYAFAREMFEAGRLAGVAASRKHETPPPSPCQGHARQQEADEASQDSPWIDPNDKTQKQFLPWVGEKVLFCHAGMTYYGKHTGGSFQSFNPPKQFNTWSCRWMYPPKAAEKIQQTEAQK